MKENENIRAIATHTPSEIALMYVEILKNEI